MERRRFLKFARVAAGLALGAMFPLLEGCTSRSITITTNPPGAEVSVNYRVIGISPCRVGFTHYGVYRIEIRKEGFETLVREENIKAPLYGYEPISAFADNAIPARLNDDVYLHFKLTASGDVTERTALLQRAAAARTGIGTNSKGETVQLAYEKPPKVTSPVSGDKKPGDTVTTETVKITPVRPDELKIKPLDVKEPEGPKLSKELNVPPATPEKKPDAPKPPEPPKEPKKETTPPRTPKSEELIFEKPEKK